jgi:hypothetical protein
MARENEGKDLPMTGWMWRCVQTGVLKVLKNVERRVKERKGEPLEERSRERIGFIKNRILQQQGERRGDLRQGLGKRS